MAELRIEFEQQPSPTAAFVREHLGYYNVGVTGVSSYYDVYLYLRNERGETLGGLIAACWGGWMHIANLWVDEAVRGQGWATRLMDMAETYALERGCHSVELDTHSFQARPFYEKRGYDVFATLDDYPEGHKKFYLKKRLKP